MRNVHDVPARVCHRHETGHRPGHCDVLNFSGALPGDHDPVLEHGGRVRLFAADDECAAHCVLDSAPVLLVPHARAVHRGELPADAAAGKFIFVHRHPGIY